MSILSFFRKSAPSAPFTGDDAARMKFYKKLRFQSFIAGTVGYSATDVLLLKKYIEAVKRDAEEITIDEKDFPNRRPEAIVYPDTIPVMFNLLRDDADGPSARLRSRSP